jgi:hypothetical protein
MARTSQIPCVRLVHDMFDHRTLRLSDGCLSRLLKV